jgi:hypothetical protein
MPPDIMTHKHSQLSIWIDKAEMAKLNVPPLPTTWLAVRGPHQWRLPAVAASKIPTATTVPQEAVAVGKVIAELLLVVPLVPADGLVVVPAPPVEAQLVTLGAKATRA